MQNPKKLHALRKNGDKLEIKKINNEKYGCDFYYQSKEFKEKYKTEENVKLNI